MRTQLIQVAFVLLALVGLLIVGSIPLSRYLTPDPDLTGRQEAISAGEDTLLVTVGAVESLIPPTAGSADISLYSSLDLTLSEISAAAAPWDPNILLVGTNTTAIAPEGFPTQPVRLGGFFSLDRGLTWDHHDFLAAPTFLLADPSVTFRRLDKAWIVSGVETGHETVSTAQAIEVSYDEGATWERHQVSFQDLDNPGSTSNFDKLEKLDKQHMAVDNNPLSPRYGRTYVAWMVLAQTSSLSRNIQVSHSDDLINWSPPECLSCQGDAGLYENQGVNLQVASDGSVFAFWAAYDVSGESERAIVMSKWETGTGGWSPASRILPVEGHRFVPLPQNSSPPIRQNSFPVAATDNSAGPHQGSIYLAWTNLGSPGSGATHTDIQLAVSRDGGASFQFLGAPYPEAATTGNEQWLPWIRVDQVTGAVAVIFLDRREDANNLLERATLGYSLDGGTTWSLEHIADVRFEATAFGGTIKPPEYMTEYNGLTLDSGLARAFWSDTRTGQHQVHYDELWVGNEPVIDGNTISATYEPSSGYTTWIFQWETAGPSLDSAVIIEKQGRGGACEVVPAGQNELVLSVGVPGVGHKQTWLGASRIGQELRWTTYCGEPCSYTYRVRSSSLSNTYTGPENTLSVLVCAEFEQ